jgi:hypothetical protein
MGADRPSNRLLMSMDGGSQNPQPPWNLLDRVERAAPEHKMSKALLAYWEQKKLSGGLPRRDDIVAGDIPRMLRISWCLNR